MRTLTQGQKDAISAAVVPPVKLAVFFDGTNAESSALASQIISALEAGDANVMSEPMPLTVGGMPSFGLLSVRAPAAVKAAIETAFPIAETSSSLGGYGAIADGLIYIGYEP